MTNNVHSALTGTELHVPGYYRAGDPGAVGAGMQWVDTSAGAGLWVIKIRNAANGGWELLSPDPSAWTAYTPTVTSGSGTFTSVSAAGRYKKLGKVVFFEVVVTITTNGSAGQAAVVPLPVTAQGAGFAFVGRENAVTGESLIAFMSGTTAMLVQKYDGTYNFNNGYVLAVSGSYEAA